MAKSIRTSRPKAEPREGKRTKPAPTALKPKRGALPNHAELRDGKPHHVTYR